MVSSHIFFFFFTLKFNLSKPQLLTEVWVLFFYALIQIAKNWLWLTFYLLQFNCVDETNPRKTNKQAQ